MPAERAPVRKVREVLRLRHALGVSERQIAVTVGVSRSTVGEYLRRAAVIGITWPVPEDLDNGKLERRLFSPPTFEPMPAKPLPDWGYVHRELKRRSAVVVVYHVEIADHYYSVPSRLIGDELEARITDTTVEILHKGVRVASHDRSHARHRHTTISAHMPSAHRRYAGRRRG
jgi:transposase